MNIIRKHFNMASSMVMGWVFLFSIQSPSAWGQSYQQQMPGQAVSNPYGLANQTAQRQAISAPRMQYRLPKHTAGAAPFEWPAPTTADLVVTTAPTVEGFKITHYRGLVEGVAVREPSGEQDLAASLQGMFGGGQIDAYGQVCEEGRVQAYNNLQNRAKGMGANAVIAVRFDNETFSMDKGGFATAVVCYGTAVVIEPISNK